jgi:rhodanese-related sulfurtransferase
VKTVEKASANMDNLVNYWKEAVASTPWGGFKLSPSQLVAELNAGNSSIYIIDVRQATDIAGRAGYLTAHIPTAINIPFQDMSAAVAKGSIPKNKTIITVCYSGQSAAMTTTVLRLLGYNSYNLDGGMAAWNNVTRPSTASPIATGENFPIVTDKKPGVWTIFNPK